MHRDLGLTTDSCSGSREMHTFKKLPNSSPTPNPANSNHIAVVTPEVYVRSSPYSPYVRHSAVVPGVTNSGWVPNVRHCFIASTTYLGSPRGLVSRCKTYRCGAVTAEVAGSSPVVPAINLGNAKVYGTR